MRKLILSLGIVFFAAAAYAADQPQYAPPAEWVKPAGALNIQAPDTTTPTRVLLEDQQVKFSADGRSYYSETAAKIQNSQGLSAFGNITLNWRPDTDALIIHKLRIIRGDQTIDLLAGDRKFTVLRRENNLERAMLDGTLTAAIQPEGLQVGDILDLSYTLQRNDPVMQGHSETFTGNMVAQPVEHLSFREIWPKSKALQWRQTDGLSQAKITNTLDGNELTIEMTNTQPPKYPKGAPARYFRLGQIETSEFKSWAEVSALMAPLYKKAAVLGPDSALKAEAAKIKAASADPKIQAMAALKLVEDQVRYLYLGMNNGGYIPADADQTWTRRFGDCKGKTALLIALLHELGIEAEPALASVWSGDGLDERLPMLELFDHVLVRAVIGGKTYWLDGTRVGDRNLDDLPMPMFHWLLPVQEASAKLEKITVSVPNKPLTETQLDLDASSGLDVPAKAHATTILRSDLAIVSKLQLANIQQSDLDRYLRDYWKKQYDWIDIESVDASYDAVTGEERLSMNGSGKIDWSDAPGASGKQHQPAASVLGWKADFDREAGSKQDAPYVVAFPYFMKTVETVRLPDGGAGFSIIGTDIDKVIEAYSFKRISKIQNGVFTMEATTKALATEFPAVDAPAARKDLRDLFDMTVYLRAPANSNNSTQTLTNVYKYLEEGQTKANAGELDGAIADFSKAIQLKSDLADAYAARAVVYVSKGSLEKATSDIQKADKLDPKSIMTRYAHAQLSLKKGDYPQVVKIASELIEVSPDAGYYEVRGFAYQAMGQWDKSIADYNETLRLKPSNSEIHARISEILFIKGDNVGALAEVDKFVSANPNDAKAHALRGRALIKLGRKSEGFQEFDILIKAAPTSANYLARALLYGPEERLKALADLDTAVKLDPKSPGPYQIRANIYLANKDYVAALGALDEAARLMPKNEDILQHRVTTLEAMHQYDRAASDISILLSQKPSDFDLHVQKCRDQAYGGKALESALADCNAALKIQSDDGEALETRGLVNLLLGKLDNAIADYDAVLKQRPNSAVAHFGRGIAKLRTHAFAEAQTDFATARKKNPQIDAEFSGMERTPTWYGLTAKDWEQAKL